MKISFTLILTLTLVTCLSAEPAKGPLRVNPRNSRYFSDGSGRPVYLGGHQIFVDLQDNSFNKEFTRDGKRTLDWNEYLDFAGQYNLNYLRNWVIWSTGSGSMAQVNNSVAFPMPYKRVGGHGNANDGGLKFDLYGFDDEFFQRMHKRCRDLQDKGIYVSIMLFEVYGFLEGESTGNPKRTLWDGNVFNEENNINGIDTDYNGDGKGIEFFYTKDKTILDLQKNYVKKVIDTLSELDNVIYEIANELYAPQWQYEMIEYIKRYEETKSKQHLVMMSPGGRIASGRWKLISRDEVVNSHADCIAVAGRWDSGFYRQKNPPANQTGKPAVVDMDHVWAGSNDVGFVWSAFTRGYHFNLYDKPFEIPETERSAWECVRYNVGKTVDYADKMDIVNMSPSNDLCSTGFCLANPGYEYIVYQPGSSPFIVSGLRGGKLYYYEWYDPEQHRVIGTGQSKASRSRKSFTPANESIVLYLKFMQSGN